MGQKTHPIGFRLGISKTWRSQWYANRDFPALLHEDELLRKYLKARLGHAAIADIRIERKPGKVVVTIHTGRPGVVIGKKGTEVDQLRDELSQLSGKEVGINVEEIKRPANGNLVSKRPKGGLTPLLYAAREGALDSVRVLVKAGAKINFQIHYSRATGKPETDTTSVGLTFANQPPKQVARRIEHQAVLLTFQPVKPPRLRRNRRASGSAAAPRSGDAARVDPRRPCP